MATFDRKRTAPVSLAHPVTPQRFPQNATDMKTTHQSGRAAKANKKVPPPPPAFRLHSPVAPPDAAAAAEDGDGKEAGGGATPPVAVSTTAPTENPSAKSTKKDDGIATAEKFPAEGKEEGARTDGENDKHSSTGEMNKKCPLKNNNSYDTSSSSGNSSESEESHEMPIAAVVGSDEDAEEKKLAAKGDKKKAASKSKEDGGAARGHVKMKRTPKVPRDLPPREKIAQARKAVEAIQATTDGGDGDGGDGDDGDGDGNFKSPPEGLPTGKKGARTTEKEAETAALAGNLKSPLEAKLPAESNARSSEKPTTSTSRLSRKAHVPGGEIASDNDTAASKSKSLAAREGEKHGGAPPAAAEGTHRESKGTEGGGEGTAERRSKRARKPSLAAEEAQFFLAVADASRPPARQRGKATDAASKSKGKARDVPEDPASDLEESVDESTYPLVRKGLRDYKSYADALGFDEAYLARNEESGFEFSNDAGDCVIVIGKDQDSYIVQVVHDSRDKKERGRLYEVPIADFYNNYPRRGDSKMGDKTDESNARPKGSKRKASATAKGLSSDSSDEDEEEESAEENVPETNPPPLKRRRRTAKFTAYVEAKKANRWNGRTAMLRAHKELYGTCTLGAAPKDDVDPLLRSFVLDIRKQYKRFQRDYPSTLTAARISELRAMGFDFAPMESGTSRETHSRRHQRQWDEKFKELEAYKAKHDDCLVSAGRGDNMKLGNWVRLQRKMMNKVGREGFDPHRLAKLDGIGFDFNPKATGSYLTKKRAERFSHTNPTWEIHYQELVRYKKENGNIIVGPNTPGWSGLYQWIHVQRKEYKKREAGNEKALMFETWIAKLNDLGFNWAPMKDGGFGKMLSKRSSDKFNDLWHKHYRDLQKFHKRNGHCYVFRGGSNEVLAGWVHVQRKHKRNRDNGKTTPLTDERIKLLDDVDFDWKPSQSGGGAKVAQAERDKVWEATFQKLCAFKEQRGHASPKKTEPRLGPWASRMRYLYLQNERGNATTLSDAKIAKLQSIGFKFASDA